MRKQKTLSFTCVLSLLMDLCILLHPESPLAPAQLKLLHQEVNGHRINGQNLPELLLALLPSLASRLAKAQPLQLQGITTKRSVSKWVSISVSGGQVLGRSCNWCQMRVSCSSFVSPISAPDEVLDCNAAVAQLPQPLPPYTSC